VFGEWNQKNEENVSTNQHFGVDDDESLEENKKESEVSVESKRKTPKPKLIEKI
jgi:hypothetical protein